MLAATLVLLAFLLGSVPTGVIVARSRGVDLRKVGSGNIGATNARRALGLGWGLVVLVGDALKGFLPVALALALAAGPLAAALTGLAAIAGHSFSIFLRGRGGKGVATSLGAALALAPVPALCSLGVYAVLFALVRISSVGSLAGVSAYPLFLWLFGVREPATYLFAVAAAVLVIARHRENLQRLARGEERKG